MASQADRQIRRGPTRRRVKISVKGYSSEACGKRAPAMYSPIVTCQMTIFANLIRRVLLRCGRDHQIWRRRGRRLQMVFKEPDRCRSAPCFPPFVTLKATLGFYACHRSGPGRRGHLYP